MKKGVIAVLIILMIVVAIFILLFILRLSLPRQMDDVSPERYCEQEFIEKSDVLMVIPLLENKSIADNLTWCSSILELNKEIGMHGVYHTEDEFKYPRDREYIQLGINEFNKCFGFYPSIFSAPGLELSEENKQVLEEMNFTLITKPSYITHKVYHCVDFQENSWLVKLNKFNKIL